MEKFKWEKQKFLLVSTVVASILISSLYAYLRHNENSANINEYSSYILTQKISENEEIKKEIQFLKEENINLSKKIQETQSIVSALQRNQEAQQALLIDKKGSAQ